VGSNPGHCGGKPVTEVLSHGTTFNKCCIKLGGFEKNLVQVVVIAKCPVGSVVQIPAIVLAFWTYLCNLGTLLTSAQKWHSPDPVIKCGPVGSRCDAG
jgi:hypothetical protein